MALSTVQATINGQVYTLTLNGSTGKYEAVITSPSVSSYNNNASHYYPVSVTATDDAGNTKTINDSDATFGNNLKLVVKERVKPTILITSPTTNAVITNNKPSITIQIRDNDSGINQSTFSMNIDGGTAIVNGSSGLSFVIVSGGYDVTYAIPSALSDGNHTINVTVSDNDGNASLTSSQSFNIDTAPPTLSVSSPIDNLITNNETLSIQGTTNDTSSPCTVSITLNGVSQGNASLDGDGNFAKSVTLTEGTNTIVVTSIDSANKTSQVTRTVILDTIAPTITSVSITSNPVDAGQTYIIAIGVSD